jgi:class 3 adenylate cyclase
VPRCGACGAANPDGARFCLACGRALAGAPHEDRRKLATLLFCDMSGSTAMGERVDAESVREMMFRYFHEMRDAIERHGGTVEKFVGDAVMAVFGVPVAREDDAVRAVRAACEMRHRLAPLNEELERRFGSTIALRIGLNTGEVVAGDASTRETMVTGDAVNVAARLEQTAKPGEILIGEQTYRLARASVVAEPVEPLALKGKHEAVPAFRLLSVESPETAPARTFTTPMVGRTAELANLGAAFDEVMASRTCRLVTIVGDPGVGKSRLANEFLASVEDRAAVFQGRCLSYGDGITFWPIGEIVRAAARIRDDDSPELARARIREVLSGRADTEPVATAVAQAIGVGGGTAAAEQIAWAIRRLFETLAKRRPLVLLVDDLQWAEPALLDVIRDLPPLVTRAPMLVVCLARPELLESNADWEPTVRVESLADRESAQLVGQLLETTAVPADVRARVVRAAQGNPLFAEELVAMLFEEGLVRRVDGSWVAAATLGELVLPASLNALLGARLDRLATRERAALERGAVEGEVFHRGAVASLLGVEADGDAGEHLRSLTSRNLIRPARAEFAGEAAFRFRHLLIRDAAYRATAKKLRADLHARFADWLERAAGERVAEYEEILGYHLEQSYLYRRELGPLDDAASDIARRASERLLRSAERARDRSDDHAAQVLFRRVVELLPADAPEHRRAEAERAYALARLGEFAEAAELREQAAAAAREAGDEALLACLVLGTVEAETQANPEAKMRDSLAATQQAYADLERLGDEYGAVWALRLIGNFQGWLGNSREADRTWQAALERAERVSARLRDEILGWLAQATWWGPVPAAEGVARCDDYAERARKSGSRQLEGYALSIRGIMKSYLGRFEEARRDMKAGLDLLRDLGATFWWAGTSMFEADLEFEAENPQAAYDALTEGYEVMAAQAKTGLLATVVGMRSQAALLLDRDEEALELAEEAERLAAKDDFEPLSRARLVKARVMARRGDVDRADQLLQEAAVLIEPTDYLSLYADLHEAGACVHRLAGRPEDERVALERMLAAAEQKGQLVTAARARARLAEIRD